MLKIAFITDLHIDTHASQTLDINTKKNFEDTLQYVKSRNYDIIVLGGDLCNKEGDKFIYEYVKAEMDILGLPYHYISGNHDDTLIMFNVLGGHNECKNGEYYYSENTTYCKMIFLDTSKGKMSENQWLWLDQQLSDINDTKVLMFMHHPPVKAYSKHMEPRYEFQEFEKFQKLTQKYAALKFRIITGHYHLERVLFTENVELLVSPSTFIQIDPDSESFKAVKNGPLFREIILNEDGTFLSDIRSPFH